MGCSEPAQVNFDDVGGSGPTAVNVRTLETLRTSSGVRVRWQTGHELALLGFNLYRQQRGKLVKLNRVLIPSVFGGTTSGHTYSWRDRSAPRGAATYRLQAVSLSGKRSWVGAAVVAR